MITNNSRGPDCASSYKEEDSVDNSQIKRLAKLGAFWVTLTSAAAAPLAYYRNWILGQFGNNGEVVGNYAIILLFVNIVTTFVLFGGINVVTNFLPKIKQVKDKSAFIFTYSLISIVIVAFFILLINLFPSTVNFLLKEPVDSSTLHVLSILMPVIVLAQIVIFSLAGLMDFKLSSLLGRLQILLVSTLATGAFFIFPKFLLEHSFVVIALTIGLANFGIIVIGSFRLIRHVSGIVIRLYLPSGFYKFAGFVHLHTICVFAYSSVDQLFVLAALGKKELGAYFILLQLAQLITFVPSRIGQVMLASFSHLVSSDNHHDLRRAYTKLCRLVLILSTSLALFMILFSKPIAMIFGEWCSERHLYLVLMAVMLQVSSLGIVNGMLIMANERTIMFLGNSIIQICVQLAITLLFLDTYGVYAIITGKALGLASAQIGLFAIVRWKLDDVALSPPQEYWISLIIIIIAGILALYWNPLPLVWAVMIFVIMLIGFLGLIRFKLQEIFTLVATRQHH